MSVTFARDLRTRFGPARDQGSRPTCCAFACSDLHAANRSVWAPLSCEYAFHCGVRRQSSGATEGVSLHHMLAGVELDGQPLESGWPYLPSLPPDLLHWVPPTNPGTLFHARGRRSARRISDIHACIKQSKAVLIVMSVTDAFYGPFDADGVLDSQEAIDPSRVHAVIAVGHGTCGSSRVTLVRNSWGTGWGLAGHAWLSDRYLEPRLMETATILEVL